MKTVVVCLDNPVFDNNQVLDPTFAARYPGTLWIPLLRSRLQNIGWELVTGDVALRLLESGVLLPSDLRLIQHDRGGKQARSLLKAGVEPKVLCCFESPLYSPGFYASLPQLDPVFPTKILFGPSVYPSLTGNVYDARFPSFLLSDLSRTRQTSNVDGLTAFVVSNKFTGGRGKSLFRKIVRGILNLPQFFAGAVDDKEVVGALPFVPGATNLQEWRLDLIVAGLKRNLLGVFGGGWQDISNIPQPWRGRLKACFKNKYPTRIDDKLAVISGYRFCLAVENYAYPGYVTEKIFEPLVAGIIPVYLGAPDIERFVPGSCFVNLRDFASADEAFDSLSSMPEETYREILRNGQAFVAGTEAAKYSYEGVADLFFSLTTD